MEGKKRKGKRSHFDSRKKKTKTDTKIDLVHILFGAFNNFEEEAEDSEMECEDAECKENTDNDQLVQEAPTSEKARVGGRWS